jgi:hypothetical protein
MAPYLHYARYAYVLQPLGGVCLIYVALFLHEDEEGRLRSRAEEWWVAISDREIAVNRKVSSFVRGIASLATRALDRLFGRPLVSLRTLGASVLFTPASALLFGIFSALYKYPTQGHLLGGFTLSFLYLTLWAILPAITDRKWFVVLWWCSILIAPLPWLGFITYLATTKGRGYTEHFLEYATLLLAVSLICDLVYAAVTRWVLRQISKSADLIRIVYLVVANSTLLLILVAGPIFLGLKIFRYAPGAGATLLFSFAFNTIDVAVSAVAFVIGLFLLAHRLAWPLIERPIYALQRFGSIEKHRKTFVRTGLILILVPVPTVVSLIRLLLDKL